MKTKKQLSLKQRLNEEHTAGFIFVLPFIIGFLAFSASPIIISFCLSFTRYDILGSPTFIGVENFVRMFTDDEKFWKSFGTTFFYAIVSVPLKLIMALFVAMLFVKTTRFTSVMRAVYYLPSIMGGSIAVAVLWRRLFASDGVINAILGTDIAWLGRKDTAIWTLIILSVWQFGSSMLIFLAAIKNIPQSYHEAAIVDGAGPVKRFFSITLPMLTPIIFFNLINQVIGAFQAFNSSYLITQGKPLNTTLYYGVHLYNKAFDQFKMGYGCAMAWFMLLVIAFFTALIFRSSSAWVYYESEGK